MNALVRRRTNSRRGPQCKGQAVVEFAIVLPLLLLLLLGMVNIGLAVQAQLVLTHAAWEGARAGAMAGASGDGVITGAIQKSLQGLQHPEQVLIDIQPDETQRSSWTWPGPRGETLTIEVRYPARLALPFANVITIEASAVSRIEYSNPP